MRYRVEVKKLVMTIISLACYHISLPFTTCAPVCMGKPSFGDLNLVWPSVGAWGINQNQTTFCPAGYLATDASEIATYICKDTGWSTHTSCQKGKVGWVYRRSTKINNDYYVNQLVTAILYVHCSDPFCSNLFHTV